MGCKLSIGIKGDNTVDRRVGNNKITPISHEQATSPILTDRKDSTTCLLYTSPSPRDATLSRMPSSA